MSPNPYKGTIWHFLSDKKKDVPLTLPKRVNHLDRKISRKAGWCRDLRNRWMCRQDSNPFGHCPLSSSEGFTLLCEKSYLPVCLPWLLSKIKELKGDQREILVVILLDLHNLILKILLKLNLEWNSIIEYMLRIPKAKKKISKALHSILSIKK